MNKYFYCYSYRLMYFIKSQGLNYISYGFNKNNGLKYFVFKESDELDKILSDWSLLKNQGGAVKNE